MAPQFYTNFLKLISSVMQSSIRSRILLCKSVFFIRLQSLKTVGNRLKDSEKSLNFTQTCLYETCITNEKLPRCTHNICFLGDLSDIYSHQFVIFPGLTINLVKL